MDSAIVMCHVSHVTCHLSHVTCHVSYVILYLFFYIPPSKNNRGPMIRIGRESQCLPYAGFLCDCVAVEATFCSHTVPATIINTEKEGWNIIHNTIIGSLGHVQSKVSQWWVPVEQLGHQGEARSLVSLGPPGHRLEAGNRLVSSSSSDSSSFTFTKPFFKRVMPKCLLTETSD